MFEKIDAKVIAAKNAVKNFMESEQAGEATIVTTALIVVIALTLCLVFKDAMLNAMNDVVNKTNNTIEKLYSIKAGAGD